MKISLFLGAVLFGFFFPKDTRVEERAVEIKCPAFTLIASPADGKVTLDRISALSECLGDKTSQICTVQIVKLKRSKDAVSTPQSVPIPERPEKFELPTTFTSFQPGQSWHIY